MYGGDIDATITVLGFNSIGREVDEIIISYQKGLFDGPLWILTFNL